MHPFGPSPLLAACKMDVMAGIPESVVDPMDGGKERRSWVSDAHEATMAS